MTLKTIAVNHSVDVGTVGSLQHCGDGHTALFLIEDDTACVRAAFCPHRIIQPFVFALLKHNPERIVLDRVSTVSVDLARYAVAAGIEVVLSPSAPTPRFGSKPEDQRWGAYTMRALEGQLFKHEDHQILKDAWARAGYEHYALARRDHNLLIQWVLRVIPLFKENQSILDLGCGTGIFLDQLTREGMSVEGVDTNPASVAYARMLGLNVTLAEGADFLANNPLAWDAIHCSHLIEHLDFESLKTVLKMIFGALRADGRAVLVFPDPESIRSQLLGFWRDPDHVRFYHPDIIETLALSIGFDLEYNSQKSDGREIVGFSMTPPQTHLASSDLTPTHSLYERIDQLETRIREQEAWIRQLWQVNQTWAWSDDAVLVLKKPAEAL